MDAVIYVPVRFRPHFAALYNYLHICSTCNSRLRSNPAGVCAWVLPLKEDLHGMADFELAATDGK